MSDLVFLNDSGQPFCLSTDIATHFEKRHDHVLRDIDNLIAELPESFTHPNFGVSEYMDSTGRKLRQYQLTRDAFTLLVMGFTGKAALAWKLRYIEAFNQLEKAALETRESDSRMAGYIEGRTAALSDSELKKQAGREQYEKGFRDGKLFAERRDRLAALEKTARYVEKGLNHVEIGRILGLDPSTIGKRIKAAKERGYWPLAQISLPGVAR